MLKQWDDVFFTNVIEYDLCRKKFFELAHGFCNECPEKMDKDTLLAFVDDCVTCVSDLFAKEFRVMSESKFPLLIMHKGLHDRLLISLNNLMKDLKKGPFNIPTDETIEVLESIINEHFFEDDMTFADYYTDRDTVSNRKFVGARCEVTLSDNTVLCLGSIETLSRKLVVIRNSSNKPILIELDTFVKILVHTSNFDIRVWEGRVGKTVNGTVELFNVRELKNQNDRMFIRVPVSLKGNLITEDLTHDVDILNISGGGLLVETYEEFAEGDSLSIVAEISGDCLDMEVVIMRKSKSLEDIFVYGCKFTSLNNRHSEIISKFVILRQGEIRSILKKD